MFQKVIALIVLLLFLFSIGFTILVKLEDFIANFLKSVKSVKKIINREIIIQRGKLAFKKIRSKIIDLIYLDSPNKWVIVLSGTSFLVIELLSDLPKDISNNWMLKAISYICIAMLFYGVGYYIHYPAGVDLYISKLLIILIYILTFLQSFLENLHSVQHLLIIIFISIAYTFAFIKNVIDSFNSFIFQFLNFIVVLLFLNFIIIGLTFGFFYINNYETYSYFSQTDYENIMMNDKLTNLYYVIYIGMVPFFNFPSDLDQSNNILSYIPLFEHLIGYIFNLLIIGFFVSYSVSKLIERKKDDKLLH